MAIADREKAYRIYVTDSLKMIAENTGRAITEGAAPASRYAEIAYPAPEDERSPDEIIANIRRKIAQTGGG